MEQVNLRFSINIYKDEKDVYSDYLNLGVSIHTKVGYTLMFYQ